jgi:predicted GNAT family N-acyltransferase
VVDLSRVEVAAVGVGALRALRARVLRPGRTLAEVVFPGDGADGAGHFAACAPRGELLSIASVLPEPAPWAPEEPGWRLRGMATADAVRRRGLGRRVLAASVEHVARHGGGILWCNARVPAMAFYAAAGFAVRGEPWDEPDIGPHVVMWRRV